MATASVYLSPGVPLAISSLGDLERLIPKIKAAEFAEIWIETSRHTSMGVLTNQTYGHLSYCFNDGNFKESVNKGLEADKREILFYTLSGCGDTPLPARFALPIDEVLRGMLQFFKTESLPDWIEWEDG